MKPGCITPSYTVILILEQPHWLNMDFGSLAPKRVSYRICSTVVKPSSHKIPLNHKTSNFVT